MGHRLNGRARWLRAWAAGFVLTAASLSCQGLSASNEYIEPPPAHGAFDYQLGGAYEPPAGTRTVVRDREARPAKGVYSVCYVNAFQAQPQELSWWRKRHDDLLLHDREGAEIVDQDWGEALLDISTSAKRSRLAVIVGEWIDSCAVDGFQAVEPDNLDSYTRSEGLLDRRDAAAFAELLADRAHASGLAVAQKNTAELTSQDKRIGFDFAVAEECGRHDECGVYEEAYGPHVLAVEYRAADFDATCKHWGHKLSVLLRDRDLRRADEHGYLYRACTAQRAE
ncbi:endo alpha-1,4 polygalactosaminidase [Streptomyces sp. NPDC059862]|uniref:endo alpha-1,4 polygalactosaminidase n=1 Tax=unclassified Streptomyces TaxID=2593676 RepID=UPI00363ADD54